MKILTEQEFKELTTKRDTDHGIFYETKTETCKYGQAYSKADIKRAGDILMDRYVGFYYGTYLLDVDAL